MAIKELTKVTEPEVAEPKAAGKKNAYARLTTLAVEALKEPGRYPDKEVKNLYLYVSEGGSKTWRFIYKFHGRQREAGFGNFKDVPLKAARDRATEGRRLLAEGKDPLEVWRAAERASAPVPTFAEAVTGSKTVTGYLEAQEAAWTSEKHRAVVRSMLETYAKGLMNLRVNEIAPRDVEATLIPLVKAGKVSTAMRLRGHIEATLSMQISRGHISGLNPARWKDNIKHLVKTSKRVKVKHFAAMDYEAVPGFIARLRERRVNDNGSINVAAYALEFCILTATRANEALGAKWSEIDRANKVWLEREEKDEDGKKSRFDTPLSDAALDIIDAMAAIRVNNLVFPSRSKFGPLDAKQFFRLRRRMGAGDITAHGFRSSFRDWAGDETNFPRHVCEMALGHKVGNATEQSYRRKVPLKKLRDLFELWAAYVSTPPTAGDNVYRFPNKAQA
jgi:integrase